MGKYTTKHEHTSHGKYAKRLADRGETTRSVRIADPVLSDGKRASAKR